MNSYLKCATYHFRQSLLGDFLGLVGLSAVVILFLAVGLDAGWVLFDTYSHALVICLGSLGGMFGLWFCLLLSSEKTPVVLRNARVSLAPFLILPLIIPYNFFFYADNGVKPLGVLAIVLAGVVILNFVLRETSRVSPRGATPAVMTVAGAFVYAVIFSVLSVWRHFNYQNLSSFDVAIYNQIQWNSIHGHFFESSMSGSNFVTHNSPFLILLSPLYAVYPHPETLLVLKTLFLAFSAVPLYLILKKTVTERAILPLVLVYLFHPFIIGQNFNAPHEICFLPPVLLFSFYFFMTNRFRHFMIFLLLSLSVKEHIAFISVMYGLYALLLRREKKWVLTPIFLGLLWALASIGIIYSFQKLYTVDPFPAWLIENIKQRFISADRGVWAGVQYGLATSTGGNWIGIISFYSLFSSLGIVFPLLSPVILLGMPELMINLLASIPINYVTWHYNIIVSCFMILAAAMAIPTLARHVLWRKSGLIPEKIQEVMALFLFLTVASHFFLWWPYTVIENHPAYVAACNEAVGLVPAQASVSAPKAFVAYFSNRKDYFLVEDERRVGEYIVVEKGMKIQRPLADRYKEIFCKEGVRVYHREFLPK